MIFINLMFLESKMTSGLLKFLPQGLPRRFIDGSDLDRLRLEDRFGDRKPRLDLIFAVDNGEARQMWPKQFGHINWFQLFEGIIVDSFEGKRAITRARRIEKIKLENVKDEEELERAVQPVCIYEIYNGPGALPFLHHGARFRGLSLVRMFVDSVNAVNSKLCNVDERLLAFSRLEVSRPLRSSKG